MTDWNESSEFEITTKDGEAVKVTYDAHWMRHYPHMEFRGPITSTGFLSNFPNLTWNKDEYPTPYDYAVALANYCKQEMHKRDEKAIRRKPVEGFSYGDCVIVKPDQRVITEIGFENATGTVAGFEQYAVAVRIEGEKYFRYFHPENLENLSESPKAVQLMFNF